MCYIGKIEIIKQCYDCSKIMGVSSIVLSTYVYYVVMSFKVVEWLHGCCLISWRDFEIFYFACSLVSFSLATAKKTSSYIPEHAHKQGECFGMGGEDFVLAVVELKIKLWKSLLYQYGEG